MNFENRYTIIDQLLHRISFISGMPQAAIADIEDRLYNRYLANIQLNNPVFITSLPRAGTTILLNLLTSSGEFASHIYGDMPFVICPMIWQKFVKQFKKKETVQERAHGDGLMISSESPEALEEIIWKFFWKNNYKQDRIEVWDDCEEHDFENFFKNHMRKIIVLRYPDTPEGKRYISKNNLNIARLTVLKKIVPDCVIIIPFRDPVQQAVSLCKQHNRFLSIHENDNFAKVYMAGVGHYDFGANLRPVNFSGWLGSSDMDTTGVEFWLTYWVSTYNFLLKQSDENVHFLSFASLTDRPAETLSRLASIVKVKEPQGLVKQAGALHPVPQYLVDTSVIGSALYDTAQAIYVELERRAFI